MIDDLTLFERKGNGIPYSLPSGQVLISSSESTAIENPQLKMEQHVWRQVSI